MGNFNGPTPKRHRLWSNDIRFIEDVQDRAGFMPRERMAQFKDRLAVHYIDKNGVKRHTGKPKELKESQPLGPKPVS